MSRGQVDYWLVKNFTDNSQAENTYNRMGLCVSVWICLVGVFSLYIVVLELVS